MRRHYVAVLVVVMTQLLFSHCTEATAISDRWGCSAPSIFSYGMMNQACHSRVLEFPTGDIFVTLSCGSRRKIGLRRFRIVGATAIRGSQHSVRFSGPSSMPNASSASQLSEDCRWSRLRSVDGVPPISGSPSCDHSRTRRSRSRARGRPKRTRRKGKMD